MSEIYQRLLLLCEKNDISVTALCKQITNSPSNIYTWKKGNIRSDYLKKISKKFNVSVDYILCNVEHPNAVRIPIYGDIAAGLPIEAVEDILGYEEISQSLANTGEFFALKVKGDSMSPRINNNDIVIIKQQPNVEDDQIGAVLVNGFDATLKKIKHNKDKSLTLISLNESYKPMICNSDMVRILGLAYEVRGKLV